MCTAWLNGMPGMPTGASSELPEAEARERFPEAFKEA